METLNDYVKELLIKRLKEAENGTIKGHLFVSDLLKRRPSDNTFTKSSERALEYLNCWRWESGEYFESEENPENPFYRPESFMVDVVRDKICDFIEKLDLKGKKVESISDEIESLIKRIKDLSEYDFNSKEEGIRKTFKSIGITRVSLNDYLSGRCYMNGRWRNIQFNPEQSEFLVEGFVKVLGGWYSSREEMKHILLYYPSQVKQCGINERLVYEVESNYFHYIAGPSYTEELAVIRGIIRK